MRKRLSRGRASSNKLEKGKVELENDSRAWYVIYCKLQQMKSFQYSIRVKRRKKEREREIKLISIRIISTTTTTT